MNEDTPIREVLDEVVTDSEAEEVVEEQPIEEPKAEDQQPEVTQEEVEAFTEKGELQGKSPEELEEIYKNWQRSYTEKRQAETQELKKLRAELEKLKTSTPKPEPVKDERSVSQIREDIGQAQEAVQLGQMSVAEYTEHMRKLMAEEARQIAREEFTTLSTQEKEQSYQEQAYQAFIAADDKGRLNADSPTADEALIREVQEHLATELSKYMEEKGTAKGFDAGTLAKQKVDEYDARLDELVKKRTKQSTQLAQARAVKAQKSSTRGSNAKSSSSSSKSIRDVLSEVVEESGA